ncbi:hypothetical protein BB778_21610 [Pluralibacter gergoviae]|nr:hypothetical protein BB778_21610 [Pluralibacter gergoviae]
MLFRGLIPCAGDGVYIDVGDVFIFMIYKTNNAFLMLNKPVSGMAFWIECVRQKGSGFYFDEKDLMHE